MGQDSTRAPMSGKQRRAHFAVYLDWLEGTLARTPYLLGDAPSIADFSVYHTLWWLWRSSPEALAHSPHVTAFVERVAAIPSTAAVTLTAEEALALCQQADTAWQPSAPFADSTGLAEGQSVAVRAADVGRDPVQGTLVWAGLDELVLQRTDERAGVVYVHFPRLGYEVAPAPDAG